MSEATNRADFESAMKALGWGPSGFTEMRDGEYIAMHARAAWDAWQARGASIAVAYRYRWSDTDAWDYSAVCHSDDGVFGGYQCEPLYTAPPAAPITVEPVAFALRPPNDSRINLSTVFDNEAEAIDFAKYWGSSAGIIVALYTAPPTDTVNADPMNYKGMFLDAVCALAEIDKLLELPEDGCNDPQVTVSVLADYIAGVKEMQKSRDEWVDAQYAADTVNAELVAALRAVVAFVEGVPDAPEPFGIARAALSRASTEGTPK